MPRTRSRSYPAIELQEANQILRERLGELKQQGGMKHQEIAALLGYSSTSGGLGVRKIAALASYGFLEKNKGVYSLSSFGKYVQDLEPQGHAWAAAIGSAFYKPSLFEDLILTYQASGWLPENLPETLEENFQIAHNASRTAARIFLKSGQFAGVLDGHRIRQASASADIDAPKDQGSLAAAASGERPAPRVQSRFHLTAGKLAVFSLELPEEMTEEDYALIHKHLNYQASHYASLLSSRTVTKPPEPLPFRGRRGISRNT